MDLRELDLNKIINDCKNEFTSGKPSLSELQRFVQPAVLAVGFGLAEAIALAALILAIWNRLYPKADSSVPKCRKPYKGKHCGQQFIDIQNDGKFITLWCARKHKTKLRIPTT